MLLCRCRIVPKGGCSLANRLMRETGRQLEAERSLQQASAALPETLEEQQPVKWRLHQEPYGLLDFMSDDSRGRFDFGHMITIWKKKGKRGRKSSHWPYPSFLARLTLLAQTGMPVRQILRDFPKKRMVLFTKRCAGHFGKWKANDADQKRWSGRHPSAAI